MLDTRIPTPNADRADDVAAIDAVLADVYVAWRAGDADAFVTHYLPDATAILPGSARIGREAVRTNMAAGFAGALKGSSTLDQRISLRFAGDSAAVVVNESGILFAGESQVPPGRVVNATWVLEKRDGSWFVLAYHNCPKTV